MFVDDHTWSSLSAAPVIGSLAKLDVRCHGPKHLVALKLHAAQPPDRTRPEADWEDIRQIVRICGLNLDNAEFRKIVLRYGGEEAIHRVESFER
jgi:hypothetical protein